jgi:auxin-responsive protein IAA
MERSVVHGHRARARKSDLQQASIRSRIHACCRAQVVGWPPVRSYRKSCFQQQQQAAAASAKGKPAAADEGAPGPACGGVFVKVSMDGAPYLRKVDLGTCGGYRQLREALEAMFLCFSGPGSGDASGGGGSPSDFAVTYEDKDGDLMLVGDVPFG